MLRKLMKYEFKATARVFAPLYGALLIVSLLTRLLSGMRLETPQIISTILSVMLIAAAFVVTLILTLQRFYKNFMSSEGYLMFTLPVSVNKLIWSKLLVAAVWNIVCALAVFLSISVMALSIDELKDFFWSFTQIDIASYDKAAFALEAVVAVLGSVMCGILFLYACMALSLFFDKHRVAISFAAFIAITTLLQILTAIVAAITSSSQIGMAFHFTSPPEGIFQNNNVLIAHSYMALYLLIVAAFGAAFFFITRYMLKNKLNLQ